MKDNLHYILEEDGRSLTLDNGVVNSHSQPMPLKNTPDGWRNIVITTERILAKYGMQRSFTTPMGFVNDGATILRDVVLRQNYERKLFFLIQRLSPEVDVSFFRLIYRYLYKGELDLSTFKDEETKVTCGIMEGGISKLIKAGEGTTFEIPFDSDAINVKMDGISLSQNAQYGIIPIEDTSSGFANGNTDLKTQSISLVNKEGTASGIALFDQTNEQIDGSISTLEYMAGSDNHWAINNSGSTINLHIKGKMKFKCTSKTGTVHFSSDIKKNDDTQFIIFNNVTLVENTIYEQLFEFTIPLGPGEKLFWFDFFNNSGGGLNLARIEYLETDIVALDYTSKKETTYIKAFKPYDLFRKLIERITGLSTDALSQVLQDESNLVITCGDAIRGVEEPKVKTSLSQFFEHCAVAHFAGSGIEGGKLVIEERGHFFNPNSPVDLGQAKDLKVTLATDIIANTVKIGWQEPQVDDVNGKYSFNGSHIRSSPVTRIVKELSAVSPYGADPYEQEIIRINLEGKKTTDSSSDNKVYVQNVDLLAPETVDGIGIVYPLKRVIYDNQGDPDSFGLHTPTVFNIEELTPARLLQKHGPWLRSIFYPFDLEKLKFQSTERNALLKTILGSETIQENADYTIGSLGTKLFLPFYFEFETVVPADLVTILEANPNQCFTFSWNGDTYKGFPMKISQAVNTEESQRFKLLAAPDTNLENLIK
jgi:hypothetical protein